MKRIASVLLLLLLVGMTSSTMALVDDLNLKKGDLLPAYPMDVSDTNGIVDLTGCTVTATMENAAGTNIFTDVTATVTDAANGQVEYRWVASDTNTVGAFYIEFKVTTPGGKPYTVPAAFKAKVNINERY